MHFLMKISPDLLSQYAKHHGIDFKTKTEGASEKIADEFIKVIEKVPQNTQGKFWGEAIDIDEIGTGNGCDYLLNRAHAKGLNIKQKDYEKLQNAKERAIYFYLNFPDLFSETCDEYNIENLQGWRAEKTVSKSLEEILPNIPDFKYGLSVLYGKEYKGKNLKVKHVKRGETVTFIAYIEDLFTNDTSFKDGDLDTKIPRKPVFSAYFLYRPNQGILEVKAKGGKKRIRQLQEEFIKHMLKESPNITNEARYDFDKIQNIDALTFPTEAKDLVESVTLKALRLIHNTTKKRLSIDLGNNRGEGTEAIIKSLKEMNIDLFDYQVTQCKIEVIFDNLGKGRKRKLTVTITYPNICDLKERDIDIAVGRLLKKWKLDLF